ncbi:MAG TPA: helix-turn-helix transcriptional regulator [Candidatus Saccharimonadales bacterium]|nr:helix-turn-helix transcriptional regulator [Candidatus Saccharimonadales bacterium]
MDLYQHVAVKIKELRMQRSLTQEELAKGLKVATNTVSRWETVSNKPDLEDLEAVARYFKVSILSFFPGQDPSTKPELQALLRAAGNLKDDDLQELQRYAEFRQARFQYDRAKTPKTK